jgi:hypothetical protein
MFLLVPQAGRRDRLQDADQRRFGAEPFGGQREAIAADLRAGAAREADHDVWVNAKAKVQTLPGGWSWWWRGHYPEG